jgi:hypothetical protein
MADLQISALNGLRAVDERQWRLDDVYKSRRGRLKGQLQQHHKIIDLTHKSISATN